MLAGGSGSRLLPLTRTVNKHLLPVGHRAMIDHPVQRLVDGGLREILVVTGVEHFGDLVQHLGSGARYGCDFTYKVQDEPLGIAHALGLAEDFARGEPVCVVLGDNVFRADLRPLIAAWDGRGARVHVTRVEHPERFGVPRFGEGGALEEILEKPEAPPSPYAVTGVYLYDATVYAIVRELTRSARGEYEITDVNNHYLQQGTLTWAELPGRWTDAGTHTSYARAQELVR